MAIKNPTLKARKQPVQARSEQTLTVIFDATVQVLLRHGYAHLTTTRIAERAGVSVGSLYQYFPNKQSLLAAVLGRHLDQIAEAMESACIAGKGQDSITIAHLLVDAFVDAKTNQVALSRALYLLPAELGSDEQVAQTTARCAKAIGALLATQRGNIMEEPMAVFVVTTCLVGPVQALLSSEEPEAEKIAALRLQLKQLLGGYLKGLLNEPLNGGELRPATDS